MITAEPSTRIQWSYQSSISARFAAVLTKVGTTSGVPRPAALAALNEPGEVGHHLAEAVDAHDFLIRLDGNRREVYGDDVYRQIGKTIDCFWFDGEQISFDGNCADAGFVSRFDDFGEIRVKQRIADAAEDDAGVIGLGDISSKIALAVSSVRSAPVDFV